MKDGIYNVTIDTTMLGFENHGIFSSNLTVLYGGGGGQGFGGWTIGDEWIKEVLKTVGVDNWEDLRGEKIRVRIEEGRIVAIGHWNKDKWFCPKEYYKNDTGN